MRSHHLVVKSRSTFASPFMEVVIQRPILCETSSATLFNPVGQLLHQRISGLSR